MRLKLLAALLLCLSLLGCGQTAAPASAGIPNRLAPTKETENDTLRCYPLDSAECRFFVDGEDLLLVSGTSLRLFHAKALTLSAARELPCGCRVIPSGGKILCYDRSRITILSPALQELQSISLSEAVTGTPVLSDDGTALYYSTSSALMSVDLNTGIQRMLRKILPDAMSVSGFLHNGGALLCSSPRETAFVSCRDGSVTGTLPPVKDFAGFGSRDYLAVKCGANDCLYLGQSMLPLLPGWEFLCFLPEMNGALVYLPEPTPLLTVFDLTTGNRIAQLRWEGAVPTQAAEAPGGRIFFLSGAQLWQWSVSLDTRQEFRTRITPLYTSDKPDGKGLEQCRQRAGFIEEQYDAQILLNDAASRVQPPEYSIEPEYIPIILSDTLDRIEKALNRFPAEMVKTAFQGTGRTYLCPVRSIRCKADGTEEICLQFWSGRDCYLFLAASDRVEEGVIRALSPLFDRQIMMHTAHYDGWQERNPAGFTYGREAACDLAAFADSRAVRSETDDRASLLVLAMQPGNRERFLNALLQSKLRRMCQGLRSLCPAGSVTLPWEQYLW